MKLLPWDGQASTIICFCSSGLPSNAFSRPRSKCAWVSVKASWSRAVAAVRNCTTGGGGGNNRRVSNDRER
jgi:hypothetical protein